MYTHTNYPDNGERRRTRQDNSSGITRCFRPMANSGKRQFCRWLFSNCGCHDRAADVYTRLVSLRPNWVEGYRHASGSLAAIGQVDEAVAYGTTASDLSPHSVEFATHVGTLLLHAHRYKEAEFYLGRAHAAEPENACILRALSAAIASLGRKIESADVAVRAGMLSIEDSDIVIHAAELC